jgi:hypothetical protein
LKPQNKLAINIVPLKAVRIFSLRSLYSLYSLTLLAVTILLLTFALMGYFVGGARTVPFNYYIPQAYATTADTTDCTSDATTDTTPAKDHRFKAETSDQPVINDPNLEVQQVAEGLELPISMAV